MMVVRVPAMAVSWNASVAPMRFVSAEAGRMAIVAVGEIAIAATGALAFHAIGGRSATRGEM